MGNRYRKKIMVVLCLLLVGITPLAARKKWVQIKVKNKTRRTIWVGVKYVDQFRKVQKVYFSMIHRGVKAFLVRRKTRIEVVYTNSPKCRFVLREYLDKKVIRRGKADRDLSRYCRRHNIQFKTRKANRRKKIRLGWPKR